MIYVPNTLTILRIASVPFLMILLFNQQYSIALLLFLLAGVSDALDGFLAHRYNCVTKLGERLDPVADKCLLVTSFIMLSYLNHIPFWLVVVVVFRDVLIIGGVILLMLMHGKVEIKPLLISKLNTFLQIALVLIILLHLGYPLMPHFDLMWAYIIVATITVFSGCAYIWQGLRFAMHGELK